MKILVFALVASTLLARAAAAAPILKVSAVQMRSVADLDKNVQKISQFLGTLAGQGVQIAVFPECALTEYDAELIKRTDPRKLAAALDAVGAACRKNKICAVMGSPEFRPDGKMWNSAWHLA